MKKIIPEKFIHGCLMLAFGLVPVVLVIIGAILIVSYFF